MKNIIEIESINQLHKALGHILPKHPLISMVNFNEINISIEASNIKFITGYYAVIFKQQTHCEFKYGRGNYDFEEGSLMFLQPGQVIKYDEIGETDMSSFKGWGLFFHPDLIRKSFLADKMKDYTFFSYE